MRCTAKFCHSIFHRDHHIWFFVFSEEQKRVVGSSWPSRTTLDDEKTMNTEKNCNTKQPQFQTKPQKPNGYPLLCKNISPECHHGQKHRSINKLVLTLFLTGGTCCKPNMGPPVVPLPAQCWPPDDWWHQYRGVMICLTFVPLGLA
jgi:hypothetical protein